MSPRRRPRWFALAAVALLPLAASAERRSTIDVPAVPARPWFACVGSIAAESQPIAGTSSDLELAVARRGAWLDGPEVRALETAGDGESGVDDAFLDPERLTVVRMWPIEAEQERQPARAEWPGRPVTLAVAWPTASGYVNLLVDLDRPGRWLLELAAASQQAGALDAWMLGHAVRPTGSLAAACREARAAFDAAGRAPGASGALQRAAWGERALHAVTAAYALALSSTPIGDCTAATVGITVNDEAAVAPSVRAIRRRPAGASAPAARVVISPSLALDEAASMVRRIRDSGASVMVQPVDSADLASMTPEGVATRVRELASTLGPVQGWEIGNEVNGAWAGQGTIDKVLAAAGALGAAPPARMLTLAWQLGEDDEAHSLFTWLDRHLTPEVLAVTDSVGLSIYPENAPMGPAAFERVLRTLRSRVGDRPIVVSELGYWSGDLSHRWWWGDRADPTGRGRRAVFGLYERASRRVAPCGGGTFWWYFGAEVASDEATLRTWLAAS